MVAQLYIYYASWKDQMAVVHLLLKEKADVRICKEVCVTLYGTKGKAV